MTEEEQQKSINYFNPLSWMKGICISVETVLAVISHYFVYLLIVLLIGLLVFFAYDRYMFYTYNPEGKYHGPFSSKQIKKEAPSQQTYRKEKKGITQTAATTRTTSTHKKTKDIQKTSLRPVRSSIQNTINKRLGKSNIKYKKDQK